MTRLDAAHVIAQFLAEDASPNSTLHRVLDAQRREALHLAACTLILANMKDAETPPKRKP